MPDTKITALTALTTADPATDMFPVVDVSDTTMAASGTTKRISINNILACSPSATLASATITGDLTVDTSTLKVDSANNRVIVGHTSGASAFQVSNAGAAGFEVQPIGVNSAPAILSYNRSGAAWIQLTYGASSHVWQNSGTDAMTLNSTGLGVGVSPSYNIDVLGATLPTISVRSTLAGASNARLYLECAGANSGHITYNRSLQALTLGATGGTTAQVTLDSAGNVGIGVVPAALSGFGSTFRQKGVGAAGGIFTENNTGASWFGAYSGTSLADSAALIYPAGGTLRFATTTSVGVGGFTPLMTLDASGNLILQPPSSPPTLGANGQLTVNATSNTNLRFSYRGSDGVTRVANLTLA
jgi:hypothetical protein